MGMGIPMGMGWEWESYLSYGNSHRFSNGNPEIPYGFPCGNPKSFPMGIPWVCNIFYMERSYNVSNRIWNSHRISTGEFPCENP